ncbi:exodeoxyribonuclease III [Candidatus Endobugula sertula]|uniref:Exodeoxyribonuclease III n=1 Tax=Candidatus Endobugula sertula TaxID=62101 RepID=A0A1D2QRP1_9GAMM|nr:exodeoxyribonuclease III [Candidatus Endobugula sertula]
MKAVSFNVNSIRQRLHQLDAVIQNHQPDFIGLQETKVTDDDFPIAAIQKLGYYVEFHGQKTHYGVALLSRHPFLSVQKGYETDTEESQKRFIAGRFASPFGGEVTVVNGYFPQGENKDHPTKFPNKEKYYKDLNIYLKKNHSPDEQVIVMGDMNVSPTDDDIGIGENNRKRWLKTGKCSFLPIEREWLDALYSWGLQDSYRHIYPDNKDLFSWFDYRSRGFEQAPKRGLRIDLILATQTLMDKCKSAGINYEIRAMDKSSDHCPVWTYFK